MEAKSKSTNYSLKVEIAGHELLPNVAETRQGKICSDLKVSETLIQISNYLDLHLFCPENITSPKDKKQYMVVVVKI